jgi:hypothetical protein
VFIACQAPVHCVAACDGGGAMVVVLFFVVVVVNCDAGPVRLPS